MHKLLLGIFIIFSLLSSCSTDDILNQKRKEYILEKERSNNALRNADKLQRELDKEL